VATHPKEAIGIGLGVVAVATGGAGLLVEGAVATTILSATPFGTWTCPPIPDTPLCYLV